MARGAGKNGDTDAQEPCRGDGVDSPVASTKIARGGNVSCGDFGSKCWAGAVAAWYNGATLAVGLKSKKPSMKDARYGETFFIAAVAAKFEVVADGGAGALINK
jgi:hypothetical protein